MRVDNHNLDPNPHIVQVSPNGKEYRVISLEKDLTREPKWNQRKDHYEFCWIVIIKFTGSGKKVQFNFDYNDNCIKKEKVPI